MIRVAITGGIGSGKSTVCKIFNTLGIETFDSDTNVKKQYLKDDIKEKVLQLVNNSVLIDDVLIDGEIDLKKISTICFKDKLLLNNLTDIVVEGLFIDYYDFLEKSISHYTLFESAILFNHNKDDLFDVIIGVVSDKNVRIDRVMNRSNLNREQVIERMNNQVSDDFIIQNCDYIIRNNSNIDDLFEQISNIHLLLCKMKNDYKK